MKIPYNHISVRNAIEYELTQRFFKIWQFEEYAGKKYHFKIVNFFVSKQPIAYKTYLKFDTNEAYTYFLLRFS
jgi:hypothetical protein